MKPVVEILAPAGSPECMKAAIKAGADAIYVGGSRFGARAFADNFSEEQLLEAIDYVHLHGRKIYLTVNTLLKEKELTHELYDYLLPYYLRGLDAVIVQDLGVLRFVREHFSDLPVHASTQMTITSVDGARLMEECGAERIVTSRELGLAEIREIADGTSLEIESFVHGALCYSYSGQCLFSSLVGGRSGNRGQCAQPCRLPYRAGSSSRAEYLLSLKDICTLDDIPDLIEAGIYSFKIEGRMKKPEYVAGVTAMYRKYTDLYLQYGKEKYAVSESDRQDLMDLYNRGGFHGGYYKVRNGREIVSKDRPNHAGVAAIQIKKGDAKTVTGRALCDLHAGDVLELPNKETDTIKEDVAKGQEYRMRVSGQQRLPQGTVLFRTRNPQLIKRLQEEIVDQKYQEKIRGEIILSSTKPARLRLAFRDKMVEVTGNMPEKALRQPTDAQQISRRIKKTGNTEFAFEELTVTMDEELFVPVQELNDLRRRAINLLEEEILTSFRRDVSSVRQQEMSACEKKAEEADAGSMRLHALAETEEQFWALLKEPQISRVYLDASAVSRVWGQDLSSFITQARSVGKEIYFAMPHIFRQDTRMLYDMHYENIFCPGFDGVLIRNMESFIFLRDRKYSKAVVCDHHLYQFNRQSILFWKERNIRGFTAPLELNYRELFDLDIRDMEIVAYGYLPMMISAQCIQKTVTSCTKESKILRMQDRQKKEFFVKNRCDYCYNVIYNSFPLDLSDQKEEMGILQPKAVRLSFTRESGTEVHDIVRRFAKVFVEGERSKKPEGDFTRGHFKRGVR